MGSMISRARSTVHPRVGGEHPSSDHATEGSCGSSPRGRGTLHTVSRTGLQRRFIPAWAGNTAGTSSSSIRFSVHPRVGGEHSAAIDTARYQTGSSPRGRGTPAEPRAMRRTARFIPAWAGNTHGSSPTTARLPVHPRVGGEHSSSCRAVSSCPGSSPRGRGTPATHEGREGRRRFIPAWAGNTGGWRSPGPCPAVHPRVGGEHSSLKPLIIRIRGSSPRGRGTRIR